jgi:hypothetical protein
MARRALNLPAAADSWSLFTLSLASFPGGTVPAVELIVHACINRQDGPDAKTNILTEEWGNPSSRCRFGSKLKGVKETARDQMGELSVYPSVCLMMWPSVSGSGASKYVNTLNPFLRVGKPARQQTWKSAVQKIRQRLRDAPDHFGRGLPHPGRRTRREAAGIQAATPDLHASGCESPRMVEAGPSVQGVWGCSVYI